MPGSHVPFVVVSGPVVRSGSWRSVHNACICAQYVALGGLVWNFPTSCAWAARVYVSHRCAHGCCTPVHVTPGLWACRCGAVTVHWADRGARDHGLKVVGLPSRFANFQAGVDGQERSADAPSPSSSPVADDWWSAGLLVF